MKFQKNRKKIGKSVKIRKIMCIRLKSPVWKIVPDWASQRFESIMKCGKNLTKSKKITKNSKIIQKSEKFKIIGGTMCVQLKNQFRRQFQLGPPSDLRYFRWTPKKRVCAIKTKCHWITHDLGNPRFDFQGVRYLQRNFGIKCFLRSSETMVPSWSASRNPYQQVENPWRDNGARASLPSGVGIRSETSLFRNN